MGVIITERLEKNYRVGDVQLLPAQEHTELELYLTSLANGSPMLAPTMSRLHGPE